MCAPVPLMRKTVRDTEVAGYYIPANTVSAHLARGEPLLAGYWTNPTPRPAAFSEERREDRATGSPGCRSAAGAQVHRNALRHLRGQSHPRNAVELPVAGGRRLPGQWDNTSLPVPSTAAGSFCGVELTTGVGACSAVRHAAENCRHVRRKSSLLLLVGGLPRRSCGRRTTSTDNLVHCRNTRVLGAALPRWFAGWTVVEAMRAVGGAARSAARRP